MNNTGTISLETKRLLLRQFTMEDSNSMFMKKYRNSSLNFGFLNIITKNFIYGL